MYVSDRLGFDATVEDRTSGIRFPVGTTIEAMERELISQTLTSVDNNKTKAAELLGISLKTLHNKLKAYNTKGVGG